MRQTRGPHSWSVGFRSAKGRAASSADQHLIACPEGIECAGGMSIEADTTNTFGSRASDGWQAMPAVPDWSAPPLFD